MKCQNEDHLSLYCVGPFQNLNSEWQFDLFPVRVDSVQFVIGTVVCEFDLEEEDTQVDLNRSVF